MLPKHKPKTTGPISHELKPPKPQVEINTSSFKVNHLNHFVSDKCRKQELESSRIDHTFNSVTWHTEAGGLCEFGNGLSYTVFQRYGKVLKK